MMISKIIINKPIYQLTIHGASEDCFGASEDIVLCPVLWANLGLNATG